MFVAVVIDRHPSGLQKYPTTFKVIGLYNTDRGAKCAVTRNFSSLREDEKSISWQPVEGCHVAGRKDPLLGWNKRGVGFVFEVRAMASTIVPFADYGVGGSSQVGFWLEEKYANRNAVPVRVPNWGTLWVGVF